jgi:asparagine N-glycosylation enzyme membrane subunit Stt3
VATAHGPGPLAPVHRITIITAFLGALAYLVWEIDDVITTGTTAAVARCVAAAAFVVALGLYLRNLRARLDAKLRPIVPPPTDRPAA